MQLVKRLFIFENNQTKPKKRVRKKTKTFIVCKVIFFRCDPLQFCKVYDVMLLSLSAIRTENARFMSKCFLMRSSQQSMNFHLVPSQFQSVFCHADSPPVWQSSNRLSYCFTLIPADRKSKMLILKRSAKCHYS